MKKHKQAVLLIHGLKRDINMQTPLQKRASEWPWHNLSKNDEPSVLIPTAL